MSNYKQRIRRGRARKMLKVDRVQRLIRNERRGRDSKKIAFAKNKQMPDE